MMSAMNFHLYVVEQSLSHHANSASCFLIQ